MTFVRYASWITGFLLASLYPALLRCQQRAERPIETSICVLQKEPQAWNHKLVRVNGYATHGYEESSLVDPTCNSYVQGTPIWMEYGGLFSTGTTYFGGGANTRLRAKPLSVEGILLPLADDANFKQLDSILQSPPDTRGVTIVRVTVQGHFFAGVEHKGEHDRGYGHFGCCTLFVIEKVDQVAEHELNPKEVEKLSAAFHLPPPAPPIPKGRKQ